MQFKQIERSANKALSKISGYASCLATTSFIDPQYAARFYKILADFFKCEPRVIMQSVAPVGLFASNVNADKNKLKLLREFIWRLCANTDLLKRGTAVLPYRRLVFDGTEEVRFTGWSEVKGTTREKLTFVVLTGHYAAGKASVELTAPSISRILSKIGYSGTKKFPSPSENIDIVGLYAKLKLAITTDERYRVEDVVEDDSITAYNRKTMINYRVGNVLCPQEAGRCCSACTCTTDECPASFRLGDWYGNC